jgi:hypothetical protein
MLRQSHGFTHGILKLRLLDLWTEVVGAEKLAERRDIFGKGAGLHIFLDRRHYSARF